MEMSGGFVQQRTRPPQVSTTIMSRTNGSKLGAPPWAKSQTRFSQLHRTVHLIETMNQERREALPNNKVHL